MKHSVYTTHVAPWLHRHRLLHIHIHTRKRTSRGYVRRSTRIPGGPKVVLVDARATRSIHHVASCASTPRNVGAPLPRRPCLLSFSFYLSLLSLSSSLFYPPTTPLHRGRRVRPPLREKRRYGGNGLSAGRRLGEGKYLLQQNFSTHSRGRYRKKIYIYPVIREGPQSPTKERR